MTYAISSSGRRLSVIENRRDPQVRQRNTMGEEVGSRAHTLVREIWQEERWKSSIASKVAPYLRLLVVGRSRRVPQGIPQRILDLIHRCFAQACLEFEAEGLNGQRANWYEAAEAAARQQMSENPLPTSQPLEV